MPAYAKSTERVLALAEAQRLLGAMVAPRERLIIRIHLLCGLRPGETFALRWNDVRPPILVVDETVNIGRDKKGVETVTTKTAASTAPVAHPKSLRTELEQWRMIRRPVSDDEFLFPSSRAGKPLSYNSYLKDVLKPIADGIGVPGLTFQALRRTFTTLASPHGDQKDVQAQMRHAHAATTMDVYVKSIPGRVFEMVEELDKELEPGGETGKAS